MLKPFGLFKAQICAFAPLAIAQAAREARADPPRQPPVPFALARSKIRAYGRQKQWAAVERDSHWWAVTEGRPPKYPEGLTRGQERIIAQLRAGKCPITAEYRHRCGWEETPACVCGAAVESVAHLVLACPRYEKERQRLLHWEGGARSQS